MTTSEKLFPSFANPPIVETILGVQFEPVRGFRSWHYGWFLREFLQDWIGISDEPLLPPYQEIFDSPKLASLAAPMRDTTGVRMRLKSKDRTRSLQVQRDKFYFSWTRGDQQKPRYDEVKHEFLDLWAKWQKFLHTAELGSSTPNLWEVQYVNFIPPGELWTELADWPRVLPWLAPAVLKTPGVRFATYDGTWYFEIEPKLGRVQVRVAKMLMNDDPQAGLRFNLTARGNLPAETIQELAEGIDLGHRTCVGLFCDLTSMEAQTAWGRTS